MITAGGRELVNVETGEVGGSAVWKDQAGDATENSVNTFFCIVSPPCICVRGWAGGWLRNLHLPNCSIGLQHLCNRAGQRDIGLAIKAHLVQVLV